MKTVIKSLAFRDGAAVPVTVETEISDGIGIHVVGLSDAKTRETLLRTLTAMQSLGFLLPGKKIVVNVSPSLTRHGGKSMLDLPVAVGILSASGQIGPAPDWMRFVGNLSLSGRLWDDIPVMQVDGIYNMDETLICPVEMARVLFGPPRPELFKSDNLTSIIAISMLASVVKLINNISSWKV